jgi:hypothetical protein
MGPITIKKSGIVKRTSCKIAARMPFLYSEFYGVLKGPDVTIIFVLYFFISIFGGINT